MSEQLLGQVERERRLWTSAPSTIFSRWSRAAISPLREAYTEAEVAALKTLWHPVIEACSLRPSSRLETPEERARSSERIATDRGIGCGTGLSLEALEPLADWRAFTQRPTVSPLTGLLGSPKLRFDRKSTSPPVCIAPRLLMI